MKKVFKKIFLSAICMMALATIASCDKDSNNTGSGTPGGGITPAGYVDLGLPSGTKWKAENEENPNKDGNNFYTWDEAMATFGNKLPTIEQFQELIDNCTWNWNTTRKGYDIRNNGNSIFLPAAGIRDCNGNVRHVGAAGAYWSSTPYDSEDVWGLSVDSGSMYIGTATFRCVGYSVRLVQ